MVNLVNQLHGIVVLNKPRGMTSHDCVGKIRRLTKIKKVGHTGTLDPEVSGVLPLCIGQATRLSQYLIEKEKEYVAEVTLGKSTTTQDQVGEVLEDEPLATAPTIEQIMAVLEQMRGTHEQMPPMYSAVKVGGKKLYELAREGKSIERKTRQITVHDIQLIDTDLESKYPAFTFRVCCSKGTYVRTLGVDIGEKLGYPAHMSSLERTKSGPFRLDQSYSFEQIEAWTAKDWEEHLVPMDQALDFPRLTLTDSLSVRVLSGQSIKFTDEELEQIITDQPLAKQQTYRLYDNKGKFIALYVAEHSNLIKPLKVFHYE